MNSEHDQDPTCKLGSLRREIDAGLRGGFPRHLAEMHARTRHHGRRPTSLQAPSVSTSCGAQRQGQQRLYGRTDLRTV